jgi:hypothetical protein
MNTRINTNEWEEPLENAYSHCTGDSLVVVEDKHWKFLAPVTAPRQWGAEDCRETNIRQLSASRSGQF